MYSLLQQTPGPASCLSALVSLKKTSCPACWASTKSGNGFGTLWEWGGHMSTWIAALANVLHLYRQPFPVKESLWLTAPLPQGTKVQFRDLSPIPASWSGPGSQKTETEMEWDAQKPPGVLMKLLKHQLSVTQHWGTRGNCLTWQVFLILFHRIHSKIGGLIFLSSFHDDVPKDYRQVSLMAVKQRFEDERYEEIGKEQVGELWLHLLLAHDSLCE